MLPGSKPDRLFPAGVAGIVALIFLCGCGHPGPLDWDFRSFYKPDENPVLQADPSVTFLCPVSGREVQWMKADVFNPAAVVRDDRVFLLFRAEDNPDAVLGGRTSRIGLATSSDGIHFTVHPSPVLYPDSGKFMQYDYPGGCEDPRIVQAGDSLYVMAYTSWDRDTARLSIAFSGDLYNWEKKGPAFEKAYGGRFLDHWSKSGSMITRMEGDRQVLAEIDGKYWMYWGETFINPAWSENLEDWYPVLNDSGGLNAIVEPRPGMFDSHLTECGPPAIITREGIALFYNGRNSDGTDADPDIPRGMYSVGRVVFDPADPARVVDRSDTFLLRPTLTHEITGQYASGTTFAEALVWFRSEWFLYYGTADSYVGVAISQN